MNELIAPTTAAAEEMITISGDRYVSIAAVLAGSEKVTFEVDLGGVFVEIKFEGTAEVLDSDTNLIQLAGPNTYLVKKTATVASVGVFWVE